MRNMKIFYILYLIKRIEQIANAFSVILHMTEKPKLYSLEHKVRGQLCYFGINNKGITGAILHALLNLHNGSPKI